MPVIIVSVKELSEANKKKTMNDLHIEGWISKPIHVDKLLNVVSRLRQSGSNQLSQVLHVEDDDDVLNVVSQVLEGIAVIDVAKSCHSARQKLAQKQYDLILLDLKLPDGSGLDLLSCLSQQVKQPKIVIFSAMELSVSTHDKIAAILLKSDTSNEKLKATIQDLLGQKFKQES